MLLGSIVLAGGRSRRMGQPKEALAFRDSTLLGHTVELLEACCHPVMVVARDPEQELPPLPIETDLTYDGTPGGGPLVGIAAGMHAVEGQCDAVFVTTCDAPFLTEDAVAWLFGRLGEHDLVIPRVGGMLQPLTAIYRTRVLGKVDELIAQGASKPRDLVDHVDTRILEEDEVREFDADCRFLRNVNSPEEYAAVLEEIERTG